MAHDVFISYSSVDTAAGETVCSMLKKNGISCWIAPRDKTPGLDFAFEMNAFSYLPFSECFSQISGYRPGTSPLPPTLPFSHKIGHVK